jgi:predicted nucleotidyltransferase
VTISPLLALGESQVLEYKAPFRKIEYQLAHSIHQVMRLTPSQAQLITDSVHRHFGTQAKIWLFGSRTDDCKRGGDVDLYVEADHPELLDELRCKVTLEDALDLHVDLVVKKPGQSHPIHAIARAEGVLL